MKTLKIKYVHEVREVVGCGFIDSEVKFGYNIVGDSVVEEVVRWSIYQSNCL